MMRMTRLGPLYTRTSCFTIKTASNTINNISRKYYEISLQGLIMEGYFLHHFFFGGGGGAWGVVIYGGAYFLQCSVPDNF